MKKLVSLFLIFTLVFTVVGTIYAADIDKEKALDNEKLSKIDKKADEIWVKSGGDIDQVKEYYESVGYVHEKRASYNKQSANDIQGDVSILATPATYNLTMDFYRTDGYTVKVWANVKLANSLYYENNPASDDRLAISWDKDIQNKSSEVYNFLTKNSKQKGDLANPNDIMVKAESAPNAVSYRIRDGKFYDILPGDYVDSAYIQVTFLDPQLELGTGPWTYYYSKYKHTYGTVSSTISWEVGYPWSIKVSGTSSTTESIDDYASDLGQFGP